jgi:hypothetical protein
MSQVQFFPIVNEVPFVDQPTPAQQWLEARMQALILPGLSMRELVSQSVVTQSGSFVKEPGAAGLGSKQTSNAYIDYTVGATTDFTLMVVAHGMSAGVYQNALDDDIVGAGTRKFQFRLSNTNTGEFIRFNTAGSAFTATTGAVSAGGRENGIVMIGRTVGTAVQMWIRELASGTITTGTATITSTPSTRAVLTRAYAFKNAASSPWTGATTIIADFNRALSDGQVMALLANPFQVADYPASPFQNFVPDSVPSGFLGAWVRQRAQIIGAGVH